MAHSPRSLHLDDACTAFAQGKLVVFPTETFFALGCDAMNPDAVGAVFSIKKRSLSMPLPVVIADRQDLSRIAVYVPGAASSLMDAFWPGSLSIVLPARPEVPELLTANAGRIAVRFSPHPAVLALCRASGRILAASSANISGEASVSSPENLPPEIVQGIAGIYMQDPLPDGKLPSTVVDILEKRDGPIVRILRPGAVSSVDMRAAGFVVSEPEASSL